MGLLDLFSSTPDKAKFGPIMLRWLGQHYPKRAFRFEADQFRVVEDAPGGWIYNLDNVYRDYCAAARKDRDAVLARYGQGLLGGEGPPASFDEARAHILPIIRSRAMNEYVRLSSDENDPMLAVAPFSEDALLLLAYDTEHATTSLCERHLREWGVDFETVQRAALDNLRDATVARFEEFAPGLFVSDWNDAYDPSRLLFADVIHQVPLGGERIAMIPNRNRLFVASSNDDSALAAMVELARQVINDEGRPVSSLMYHFVDGRAVEYEPAHPAVRTALARLRAELLAEDYASQKDLLDRYNEKHGIDAHVATYQLMRAKDSERIFSVSVWTENADSLLPRTDVVALVSEDDIAANRPAHRFVQWDELQRVAGPFELVEGCYPPRYKPGAMPSEAQRLALADALA